MFDLIREIVQTLSHNRLRTALTGFAVAWGIFMLIVLLGMGRGVQNNFNEFANIESSSTLNVYPGFTSRPYKGYKEGRRVELDVNDLKIIEDASPEYIKRAQAAVSLDDSKLSTARDYVTGSVYGTFPDEQSYAKITMEYGRFLNDRDLETQSKVVVLSHANAEILFDDVSRAVGQYVKLSGVAWQVVGVYNHDWEKGSYIPFNTAMAIRGNTGKVQEINVRLKNISTGEEAMAVETAVREALAQAHHFAPDDTSAVYVWNRFNNYLQTLQATSILNIAIWVIGVLTLLSGIVGVSNIMFVSVRERTHEIGIRRAIGAKPRSILTQVVTESVAITTSFGYIGIVAGTMVTGLIAKLTEGADIFKDPTINLSIAVKVTILLIIAGALAGLFPALKAIKVKPVEALRDE